MPFSPKKETNHRPVHEWNFQGFSLAGFVSGMVIQQSDGRVGFLREG